MSQRPRNHTPHIQNNQTKQDGYFDEEIAFLYNTNNLRFYGEIIIESRADAILTATTMSNSAIFQQLGFFVDGSKFFNGQGKVKRRATSGETAGAAVVYQTPGRDWDWMEWIFRLADGLPVKSTEEAAIAEGLRIAVEQIELLGDDPRRDDAKVVIFSDCKAAILEVDRLRRDGYCHVRMSVDPIVRDIVTESQ